MQLVLDGGILHKYHRNLPRVSCISTYLSVDHKYLSSTTNQGWIDSTLFYSTLGNIETHPAVPLLKQRLHMQDNGRQSWSHWCFSWKKPSFGWQVGERWNFEDTLSKANVNVREGETVFPLSSHCHFRVANPKYISEHNTHGFSTEYITALLFSLNLLQKPELMANPWCRSINLRNTRTVFPWLGKVYIHTQHTYNFMSYRLPALVLHLRKNVGEITPLRFPLWKENG